MKSIKTMLGTLAIVCVLAALAHAGTVIKFEQRAIASTAESGKGTFYLDERNARIEFESDKSYSILLYDGQDEKNPTVWIIDQNAWNYIEVKKKDMGKLQGKIRDQLEQMQNYLRQLPAEQREATQRQLSEPIKAMEELVEPRDKGKLAYESAEAATVNDWKCKGYKVFYDGELEDQVWMASWKDAGLSRKDVSVITDMTAAFGNLTGMVSMCDLWQEGSKAGVDGFPVKTVSFTDGKEREEIKILSIAEKDIDSKLWELPNGLDETSFFGQ
jgi:hypothetical protein